MNIARWLAVLLFADFALPAPAQEKTVTLPQLMDASQQWAQQNLDSNFLNSLPQLDEQAAQRFLAALQKQFQGEYVVDLAGIRQTVQTVLPYLQAGENTRPYAAWLAAQLDYLDVADELRVTVAPPGETNASPRFFSPSPKRMREVWVKKMSARPWSAAAREYVPELKPIFAAQKIPPELVWVGEVESSFDPVAVSPASAAGMFQLMPDTAKRYGLSLWPRDQRFQPKPSAAASAKYLRHLHSHYHDWRLALAAYNAGEGEVDKLLAKHKAHSFDEIAAHLPAETQMYVPRVEAVILRREGEQLEKLAVR